MLHNHMLYLSQCISSEHECCIIFKMSYNIPMIDFSKCGLLVKDDEINEQNLQSIGDELYSALSTAGFSYLTGHGIPWSKVDDMNAIGEKFYALPLATKMQFVQKGFTLTYDPIGTSTANEKDVDSYEGFRTSSDAYTNDNISWPEVPGMRECYAEFADISSKLLMRLMKALGYGMRLKDKDYFCQAHSMMNRKGNYSITKTLKYPAVDKQDPVSLNRIGEHHDKTTMTLLFQDEMGGLQVRDLCGEFVDVQPVPEAIVLNIGGTLEAWSGERLRATKHRVIPPSDPSKHGLIRRSVAYFGQANNEVLMKKLAFEDDVDQEDDDEQPLTVEAYILKTLAPFFSHVK